MATMMYTQQQHHHSHHPNANNNHHGLLHHHHHTTTTTSTLTTTLTKSASVRGKRKSAVELLAESKPLYVKSECVRDSQQALPQRPVSGGVLGGGYGGGGQQQHMVVSGGGYGTYTRSKSITVTGQGNGGGGAVYNVGARATTVMLPQQYMAVSPSRSLPPLSHHHRRTIHSANSLTPAGAALSGLYSTAVTPNGGNNGSTTSSSDLLQNRLRQLLVCADSVGSGNSGSGVGIVPGSSTEDLSVEQLGPLSPPAEYACVGVPVGVGSQRCHKSLPDLHCRGEPSSNKSSNKSLSNRDSGGSSGHYTQHSEPPPPPRQEVRRDSGSSTQHSGASSYYCCQEAECRAAARAQQQAYVAAAMAANHHGYQPPPPLLPLPLPLMQQPQYTQQINHMVIVQQQQQQQYGVGGVTMGLVGQPQMSLPVQQQPTPITNTLQPPVNFKRQKCLRYKRDRPILRSKSDISDRYWRPPEPPISHLEQFFEHLGLTSDRYEDMFSLSRSSASPVFFSDVSTVDSSTPLDPATVDYPANHHAGNPSGGAGGAAGGGGGGAGGCTTAAFRPNEPPSIVERNARIIKWLCHCRKAQMI